jgi:hypothetical protein
MKRHSAIHMQRWKRRNVLRCRKKYLAFVFPSRTLKLQCSCMHREASGALHTRGTLRMLRLDACSVLIRYWKSHGHSTILVVLLSRAPEVLCSLVAGSKGGHGVRLRGILNLSRVLINLSQRSKSPDYRSLTNQTNSLITTHLCARF